MANKPKRKTNVQLVRDIMENSEYGALAQLFVMDALNKMSDFVADAPIEKVREGMAGGMVHPDAWHGVAKEIQKKLGGGDGA